MPIPILAVMAVGGFLAWRYRKKIKAFFESETGQKLMQGLEQASEAYLAPYQKLLDEALPKSKAEQLEFFRQAKARMSPDNWLTLTTHAESVAKIDTRYFSLVISIREVTA